MADPVNIRLSADLARELDARAREGRGFGASATARRDLERYYTVLRASRAHLATTFSRPEMCLVMDALNGIMLDSYSYQLTWAEVADAIRLNRLDEKWSVEDGDDLVRRLRALSPGHAMALRDAAEQFWLRYQEDTDTVLRDLGLLAPDPTAGERAPRA